MSNAKFEDGGFKDSLDIFIGNEVSSDQHLQNIIMLPYLRWGHNNCCVLFQKLKWNKRSLKRKQKNIIKKNSVKNQYYISNVVISTYLTTTELILHTF